jgi:hypothetical protein
VFVHLILSLSFRAAITNYHRLGDLVLEAERFKIKMPANSASGEVWSPLPRWSLLDTSSQMQGAKKLPQAFYNGSLWTIHEDATFMT